MEIIKMLEYVLFHQKPLELFVEYLKNNNIEAVTNENDGVYEIKIPEDLNETLLEEIEDKYDDLMDMNQELYYRENAPSAENFRMASLNLILKNGEKTAAHIRPDLLAQVLDVISHDDLFELVQAVVDAVENPDERTYCQKVRAGDVNF
jgi:CCR4-NOT transcriptional regulation complex NOT5 subunit